MEKIYKNVDERIEYLETNKRIIVKKQHRSIIEERSYTSLINPYKELFSYGINEKGKRIYAKNTDFEKILKIIKIDEEFSTVMYKYIGSFEKRFKNLLSTELCEKYLEGKERDITCTKYVQDIEDFINSSNNYKLPKFASNYPYTLTKEGFIKDNYNLEIKKNLLLHIKELGKGIDASGNQLKSNKLIAHYLESQKTVPLWVIPNVLTLGELKILFSMLDSGSQKKIAAKFYNIDEYSKISLRKLLSFSGLIENIRRIRNVVNHYEPLFPLLVEKTKYSKNITGSQIYATFKLLENTYNIFSLGTISYSNLNLETNSFNLNYINILEMMKEITSQAK